MSAGPIADGHAGRREDTVDEDGRHRHAAHQAGDAAGAGLSRRDDRSQFRAPDDAATEHCRRVTDPGRDQREEHEYRPGPRPVRPAAFADHEQEGRKQARVARAEGGHRERIERTLRRLAHCERMDHQRQQDNGGDERPPDHEHRRSAAAVEGQLHRDRSRGRHDHSRTAERVHRRPCGEIVHLAGTEHGGGSDHEGEEPAADPDGEDRQRNRDDREADAAAHVGIENCRHAFTRPKRRSRFWNSAMAAWRSSRVKSGQRTGVTTISA